MRAWPPPFRPTLPGSGPPVVLHDTASGTVRRAAEGPTARLYVCGITPYDATHMGHAATYVAFDLLVRAWLDGGLDIGHVQNVTDVDDPLLERATATGVAWTDLASSQIELFAQDMTALAVLPPTQYLGAVETVPLVVDAVQRLVDAGAAYRVDQDIYLRVGADERFGAISGLTREAMLALFAERGGDADREGKRDPLDSLLWRAERAGEPAWDGGSLGAGRPGWHVECTAIALSTLGGAFDVQGGGSDLVFPHHEMSATTGNLLTGAPFAHLYAHAGMVGLAGEKMSKSRGNLVLVSRLLADGVDPRVLRLALLDHHYRSDWSWTGEGLARAQARFERWREALSKEAGPDGEPVLAAVRARLADDLDAPAALGVIDAWADEQLAVGGPQTGAPGVVGRTLDALLGVRF